MSVELLVSVLQVAFLIVVIDGSGESSAGVFVAGTVLLAMVWLLLVMIDQGLRLVEA